MDIQYEDMDKYYRCLEDIGKLLYKTSTIFQLMEREQVRRNKFGTSQSMIMTELLFAHKYTLSMNDIITRMRLEKSTITRLIDALVKYGIMEKKKDTQDRRVVLVTLTQKGIEIAKGIHDNRLTYYKSIVSHLPRGHVREVMESFDVLLNALEEGLK